MFRYRGVAQQRGGDDRLSDRASRVGRELLRQPTTLATLRAALSALRALTGLPSFGTAATARLPMRCPMDRIAL